MEIRPLESRERETLLELLEGWSLPDAWRAPGYFRRVMERETSFHGQGVLVAVDAGSIVGCIRLFERPLRILGHAIPTAGIGDVFVVPECRRRGIASQLLERAVVALRERGMELCLTFGTRNELYARHGFNPWKGQRTILRQAEIKPPTRVGSQTDVEVVALDRQRDRSLSAVKAIHSAYSSPRNGTVIRDDRLWEMSFELSAGRPEEFLVARRGGLAVAYVRATFLDDSLTVTELGRFEDGASALAKLISSLLGARDQDALVPQGGSSEQLRSFVVLPTFDDIGLTVSLEHEGVTSHPIDDESGLVLCLNVSALAARLDVELLPGEGPADFLQRILPPDGFVFWPADRF